ncbi:MAG: phosphoribosylformylglycinamidine synthase subunit PurS [Candidatus Desulfofervidaceae bacterium]|nr:phosphoribosylformylglycinamidine synthase subunit PurS [Candidatus Desulfofervidaceae bacterium]
MPFRVEVGFKPGIKDAQGEKIANKIRNFLGIQVESVKTIFVYTIDAELTPEEVELIASGPFSDSIIQDYAIDRPLSTDFDWSVEVGFKPGVTDNVGKTAKEAIEWRLGRTLRPGEGVYTSILYLLKGEGLNEESVERIAVDLLANTLINRYHITERAKWDGSVLLYVPKVTFVKEPVVERYNLSLMSDEELIKLSKDRLLALDLKEMNMIKRYFADPTIVEERKKVGLDDRITDVELEAIAQTWSEHCKHKIFNGIIHYQDEETGKTEVIDSLFDTYIRRATDEIRKAKGKKDFCLSVFKDNAGVIKFNDNWNLVFKVETHNSPSALDPYGGALTGIVGVNRDPFGTGKGARLIFNTDVFCFASPFYDKPLPPRLLHPRRIFEGVREGVEHGGNKSGIPTVNGCIVFDDRYLGKPLVYCGTGGIMPAEIGGKPSHLKQAKPGDLIVMTGGRIGKDGIHGATFSSEELHEGSPVTAVQIGDPITQKKMFDFLLIARDKGWYNSITDNGAGGLSSSVGEMARESGGAELHLDRAPLKYPGLDPWEILVSESQERMTLAVPEEHIADFLALAKKMDVEATVLGKFTNTGKFHVLYKEKTVLYLDMDFFHNGVPKKEMVARWTPPKHKEPMFECPEDLTETLKTILGRLNICSKEGVVRQYDHEVQGGSSLKPLVGVWDNGPSDAAIIRPLLDSYEGVVVSNGICPRYGDIDTYHMAACALDEAVRNAICVGGSLDHMAVLDNFCWCDPILSEKNPDGPYKLAQLVRANQALYDYTTAYGVPCISGKDSMKNDYRHGDIKISIPPTILFSIIGRIEDVRKAVSMDAKQAGDLVYVLGMTYDELGASEYFAHHGIIGNKVPKVRAEEAKRLYETLHAAMMAGLVSSCHDCSDGGLGVALAETAFAGGLGLEIDLRAVPYTGEKRNDYILFSESQSRFVVTVHPEYRQSFERKMSNCILAQIGQVRADPDFIVTGLNEKIVIKTDIYTLKNAWQKTLADIGL